MNYKMDYTQKNLEISSEKEQQDKLMYLNNFQLCFSNMSLRDYLDKHSSKLENEIQHNNFWYKTTTNITGRMMYLVSLYGSQDKTNWIKLAEFYYRD
jgi:hypothetical protein